MKGYSRLFQLLPDLRRHRLFLNVKMHLIHGQDHIGEHYRIIFDIISPDIQQPYNVIQAGEHMDIRSGFLHFFSDLSDLFLPGLSGVLHIKDIHRLSGHFRTVCPDFVDEIIVIDDLSVFCGCDRSIVLSFAHGYDAAVEAKCTVFREFVGKVLKDSRNARFAHFHQIDC